MSGNESEKEIEASGQFFGCIERMHLDGVAGVQALKDAGLTTAVCVISVEQRRGIDMRLLTISKT